MLQVTKCLCSSIDKTNLGNAKTDGLTTDLNMTGNQYNILLTIFFIPYVLFGPPMNLLTKRFGAKYVLPGAMIMFGSMAMISAATSNFGGIVTTRWFLGIPESGFYAGVIYYLTTFYTRTELAGRLSIFYAASEVAGAFTGLIAYGVFQIKSHLHGWQYLFLIEGMDRMSFSLSSTVSLMPLHIGSLTVFAALIALVVLPKSAAKAYFLNEEEKKLAFYRIAYHSSSEVDSKFSFSQAISVFKTDFLWPVYMVIGFCYGVALYSITNFLPQIVQRLGYGTVKTNLFTVAPNIVGAVFLVAVSFSSDFFRERSIHIAAMLCTTATGFVILACINISEHLGVGYFACFLLCIGGFIPSPLLYSWFNNNMPDENKRAILTPFLVSTANIMGIVASNIFTPATAPNYNMASIICASFGFTGAVITLGLGFWMKYDNARRNRTQRVHLKAGDIPTSELKDGWRQPEWRWMGGIP
jgi:MFS family permease